MTFLTILHTVLTAILSEIIQNLASDLSKKPLVCGLQLRSETEEKGFKMKLINNKEFLRNAANYIDVMNTLGGGIIETQVAVEKRKKGTIIRVKAPSLSPEAFRVNLNQNNLAISAVTSFAEKESWMAPIFHQEFVLPANVALDRMRVVFANEELQVRLPYFETDNRQLPIETEDEE